MKTIGLLAIVLVGSILLTLLDDAVGIKYPASFILAAIHKLAWMVWGCIILGLATMNVEEKE